MKKYLQVKTDGGWRYVFCYSGNTGALVTTDTKRKALPWTDLDFFARRFADHEFRTAF